MSVGSADIVAAARKWLGTPYRHQASTLGAGCDCLGLVRGVWRLVYGAEPLAVPPYGRSPRDRHDAEVLERAARTVLLPREGELAAGQLVLMRLHRRLPPRHCAIMVSATRFIHAQEGLGVVEVELGESWRRLITAAFTFPDRAPERAFFSSLNF